MQWRTANNHCDCGIFTMRHMEMYMGRAKVFDTGFKRESKAQQLQLDRLRVKYLYKILTNENNLRKAAIENEVLEYMKIPSGDRKRIKDNAAANIHERLSVFG